MMVAQRNSACLVLLEPRAHRRSSAQSARRVLNRYDKAGRPDVAVCGRKARCTQGQACKWGTITALPRRRTTDLSSNTQMPVLRGRPLFGAGDR